MKIQVLRPKHTPFGIIREAFPITTVFVTDDEGRVHVNPVITETDKDCVIFEYYDEDLIGTAVTIATMTPEEALRIAKRNYYTIIIDNQLFEWWKGNRRQMPQWCAGFTKKRGHRTHLVPASMEDCLALVAKTKKIVYWTNSRRCDIIAA